jgi:NAD(P)-dependent dehydrogenase (short-subunit alcohol dehydrogenase family)
MSKFTGRVAVVTGAGSGIGRALACALAADGTILCLSDIDPVGLAETHSLVTAIGARAQSNLLDVADRTAVQAYADLLAAEFPAIHLVVNNAGVSHGGDFLGMSYGDIDRVLNVDFWGVVSGTKAFLPHLISSGDGALVNLSSLFGLIPMPGQSAYVAAKYAVRGFTESVRIEMLAAGHPVTVTCVHPGGVKTGIARNGTVNAGDDPAGNSDYFDEKLARTSADRAARLILRGAARGRPRVLIGADARIMRVAGSLSNRGFQRSVAVVTRARRRHQQMADERYATSGRGQGRGLPTRFSDRYP